MVRRLLGYQTLDGINLFDRTSEKIERLRSIIIRELELYYTNHQNDPCSYIQRRPVNNKLWGWHVILKRHGNQSPHIHPAGVGRRVIYLKVVPSLRR